jgi:membrane protein YdbS with pleckstrin-like domain
MSEDIRISLGHPVLIFIYSLALLLIGCGIGMHWYQSRGSAIWIAVAGAALMVVHDTFTGLLFASLTFRRFQKEQRSERNSPPSSAA